MDKRAVSGRGEPVPSILKKSNKHRSGDLVDKSSKIKRENKRGDVNIPLPQGCTPLMYACQQANYKSVIEILNKDVSLPLFIHANNFSDMPFSPQRYLNSFQVM